MKSAQAQNTTVRAANPVCGSEMIEFAFNRRRTIFVLRNQLNQKFKLVIEISVYVIYFINLCVCLRMWRLILSIVSLSCLYRRIDSKVLYTKIGVLVSM